MAEASDVVGVPMTSTNFVNSSDIISDIPIITSELKVTFSDANNIHQYDQHAARIPLTSSSSSSSLSSIGSLYLGDRDSIYMVQLRHRHIHKVVNCQGDMHGLSQESFVKYLNIDPIDNHPSCLELAFRFISQAVTANENVLICCQTGLGKSACVAIYFLMKYLSKSLAESHQRIESVRPGVQANSKVSGFRPALVELLVAQELAIRKCTTSSLRLVGRSIEYVDAVFDSAVP